MSRLTLTLATKILVMPTALFVAATMTSPAQALDRSMLHKVAFDENESRYPAPLAIIGNIMAVAPFRSETINDACLRVTVESAPLIGAIDPQQSQPLEPSPGPLFFSYVEKCMKRVAKFGFQDADSAQKNSKYILGPDLMARVTNSRDAATFWNSTRFSTLPRDVQQQMVERFIYVVVGPEDVLRYFNYIGPQSVFGQNFESSGALAAFILEKLEARVPGDTVLGFYSRTAVFLRLGPVMKN